MILRNVKVSSFEVQGTFGSTTSVKMSVANDDTLRKIVLEKLRKIENIVCNNNNGK